ncbi:MAG: cation diffusion facilitator family transporter [Patescibacteria group bacterium]|nr:cation diffusion facilitator family transporter [Patescibacteria group bacterium]
MQTAPSVTKVVITSFLVDLLDVLTSFAVAMLSGSVVMVAQVLEGLADLAASGFLLIGLIRSRRPSDKKHPFGYGQEIYFWTMLSSLLILGVTSTLSIYFGWQRLLNPLTVNNIYLAFIVLGVTTLTNGYALSLSARRLLRGRNMRQIGKVFTRSSLIETKTTFVLDLMGTLASIFGFAALMFYQITGDLLFDGLGAIAIGGLLMVFGVILLITIKELIIGQSASLETEIKIRKATLLQPEVKSVLGLKTLHIGSEKLLVNAEVNLKSNLTTREIEGIMDRIKKDIKREVPQVKHIQVEVETP